MQRLYSMVSYGIMSSKIKTNNKSVQLFTFGVALYCLSIYIATFVFKGNVLLSTISILYWIIATLPLMLTECNWIHPLTYQMIYEIPKVLSLGCRTSGYVELDYKWHTVATYEQCADAYIFCVLVTCLGLLIEYCVFFNLKIGIKSKEIILKKTANMNILFAIAFLAFFLLIRKLGGLGYVFANYTKRLSEFSTNTSLYLRNFIYYGIIYISYSYLVGNKKKALIAVIIQIGMFIALGERGGLISSLILPFIVLYQLKKNKCIKTSRIIAGAVILIFIYMIFGSLRNMSTGIVPGSLFKRLALTFSSIEHFVIPSELIYILNEKKTGYLFGRPLLNIFVAPFPRKYFSWKPAYIADSVVAGAIILQGSGRKVFGLPPGTFAYGYLNFGIFGLILFAVISGFAAKYLYESLIAPYWRRTEIPNGNILIYSLLIQYICDIMSTEVQIKLILYGVGIFIVGFLAKRKRKHRI